MASMAAGSAAAAVEPQKMRMPGLTPSDGTGSRRASRCARRRGCGGGLDDPRGVDARRSINPSVRGSAWHRARRGWAAHGGERERDSSAAAREGGRFWRPGARIGRKKWGGDGGSELGSGDA